LARLFREFLRLLKAGYANADEPEASAAVEFGAEQFTCRLR
jgi:hypothetical protein